MKFEERLPWILLMLVTLIALHGWGRYWSAEYTINKYEKVCPLK